jgi:hypothetical protein
MANKIWETQREYVSLVHQELKVIEVLTKQGFLSEVKNG